MTRAIDTAARPAVGAIILAAGASTRLGRPKQLLQYRGRPLIQHVCRQALNSVCTPVAVVLGAFGDDIRPHVAMLPVQVVVNNDWESGLGSSIRVGLETLATADSPVEAALLLLTDQPLVTANLIDSLVSKFERTRRPVIATSYSGTRGVPALFSRALWPELMNLDGPGGAKEVIERHSRDVSAVLCEEAALDIDTEADAASLTGDAL